ncbi:MAG: hypothetical protein HY690_13565 [Chloroflexi bacterium]|nr:hypothetical protein [Chloroflexota bacterium]
MAVYVAKGRAEGRAGREGPLLHTELPRPLADSVAAGLREVPTWAGTLDEQQIQRYEATRYASVSLDRIQAVAEALGVKVREQMILCRLLS